MAGDANAERQQGAALPAPTLLVRVLLLPAIYLCCAFAFVTDVTYDNRLAFGIAYVPGICTAVAYRRASAVWWLTGLAILLVAVGYFFPVVNADLVESLGNRMLSLGAIVVTAALVRYSRHIQEQLAAQTLRAEAAERAKTELFTNLSQEIRTPLHSIIGFAELMTANCRPDQKAPLAQMQIGGKRLLATIDNVIDLTVIEGRRFRREPVALQPLLRDLVAAAQTWASERDVALSMQEGGSRAAVETDAWAVRRIVENLLSNALKFTQKGGTVVLRLAQQDGRATIEVDDTGVGLSPGLHDLLQVPTTL
ncbi:MAG: HAMP domain-containing histidine kinase, partial [Rhodospirillales bacterium]|nr:HAMP domain-containing histidine kinase [Rhodospirillales bacterium]